MMPSWVDEKYIKREIGWIRIAGEWRPTVVLDGIPVQVTVDARVGLGPLAEARGPSVAEPSEHAQELDERAEGIASCLGHIVRQHGGNVELDGAIQKWIRDHLDAPSGVTAPTARQRVAQRFIAEQIPIIRAAARTLGYAIAIHGTLDRDVDLVAIPWTADAADADTLAAAVRDAMAGAFATTTDGRVQTDACNRPHGRRTWAIGSPKLWGSYVDLSVMPREPSDAARSRTLAVLRDARQAIVAMKVSTHLGRPERRHLLERIDTELTGDPAAANAMDRGSDAALREALTAAIEELSEWSKDCEDPESNERAGAVFRQAERALAGTPTSRPHRLTWNGTEWVAPCGCRYHPDDDKGTHGGAPHVHRCERHEAAGSTTGPGEPAFREWLQQRASWATTNDVEYGAAGLACEALARLDGDEKLAEFFASKLVQAAMEDDEPCDEPPSEPSRPRRLQWLHDEVRRRSEVGGNVSVALAKELLHAVDLALAGSTTGRPTADEPKQGWEQRFDDDECEEWRSPDGALAYLMQRNGVDYLTVVTAPDEDSVIDDVDVPLSVIRALWLGAPDLASAAPGAPSAGRPTEEVERAGRNLAMALRLQRLVLNAASASGVDPTQDEWTAFDWQRICDVLAKQIDAQPPSPIPMLLTCPQRDCGVRHIDRGAFATTPHHTHTCQACGHTWRPAKVHTVGVDFLPGFHDHDQRENDLRAEIDRYCAMLELPQSYAEERVTAGPIAQGLRRILSGERDGTPPAEDPCR